MIKVLTQEKKQVALTDTLKDFKKESILKSGDKTISFKYPLDKSDIFEIEGYIQTKTDQYVIKSKRKVSNFYVEIQANLNLEELEGTSLEDYVSVEQTITQAVRFALVGTGWTVADNNLTKKRTLRLTNKSVLDIILQAIKTYRVEINFDTINKKIYFQEELGADKGVYFIDSLNLTSLTSSSDSYEFYTRLIAKGSEDLRVVVTNNTYSDKVKTFIWKDDRYTSEESLREDATLKLKDMAKPFKSYSARVKDLASMNKDYSLLSYSLGDTIHLISKSQKIKDKQRIVKMVEYPYEPYKNTCELANTILTFEELQQEFIEATETIDNITTDNGTVDGSAIDGIFTEQIIDFEATVGKIVDLEAINGVFQEITSINATIGEIKANSISTEHLEVMWAEIDSALIGKANISELNAVIGNIQILESDTAYIKNLINGNLTSDNIHSLVLTAEKVTVENGFITNAMINNLDVNKINGGEISLDKFRVRSENGAIEMFNSTQQFKDSNNKVRLQMGRDAQGEFNFILRGADGTSVLIDHTGLHKEAITDGLIINEMLGSGAVTGDKVDIGSIIEEVNKDTNTTTIKGTKIKLDKANQSLEVAFNKMETKVEDVTTEYKDYVNSRGENLITNGTGLIGDNTNFSWSTFDASDSYYSGGSFKDSTYNTSRMMDEFIPVNPSKTYRGTAYAKTLPNVGAKYYITGVCYDADKLQISPNHTMYLKDTLTTLAKPLKKGDTKVYLTSVANWNNTDTRSYQRGFIFWNYKNKGGYQYPPNTYSRNVYNGLSDGYWAVGGIDTVNNCIDLIVPWSHTEFAEGTEVSNANSGGTYKYFTNCTNAVISSEWTEYTGTISGVDTTGANSGLKFHPATAYFKVGFLNNREVQGSTVWWSNISFALDVADQKELDTVKETVKTNTTSISANQGNIKTLIADTTVVKEGKNIKLKDAYSSLEQTVNSIKLTIGEHTTDIETVTDLIAETETKVTTVEGKQSILEQNLDKFKTSVSETYSTKTELTNLAIGGRNLVTTAKQIENVGAFDYGLNKSVLPNQCTLETLKTGDTIMISFDIEYTNIEKTATEGQNPRILLQGSGDVTGWDSGAMGQTVFTDSIDFVAKTGKSRVVKSLKLTANHMKNTLWNMSFRIDYLKAEEFTLSNFQIERGDKVTDWKPPTEHLYDYVGGVEKELLTSFESSLEISKNNILLSVSEIYAKSDDVSSIQESLSSKIDQTAKDISFNFTQATNEVMGDLSEFREQISTYIRFDIDGMELGKQGNKFKTRLTNEKLSFMQDSDEVAYVSNNKMYITDAEITNQLTIGAYAFMPRTNGNMSIKWIK